MSENRASSREAWVGALVSRVANARGYKSALSSVMKRLCRSGGWDYAEAWIPTHDGTGLKLGPVAIRERTEGMYRFRERGRELGFRAGQGLAGHVFLSGMPKWVAALGGANDLPGRQALARDAGFASAAAFPLPVDDHPVAALLFFATDPRPQDPALIEKTGVALAAVGPALEQKRIEMSVRAQARQHEVVAKIGLRALDKSADIPSLLEEAMTLAAKTLGADAAALLEIQESGRLLVRSSSGFPLAAQELDSTVGEPYFAHVLASPRPVAVPSFRKDTGFPLPSLLAAAGTVSAATAVVPGRTRPLGLLCLVSREPRRFPEDATGFLRALAQVLGVAMERDRAERELELERTRLEELVLERTAELEASHEKLRQTERLRAIATLATGITHDMNNVMLPALCRLDAIEAAGLPEAAEKEIEGVRGAFDQLRRLTRGLQLFATNPDGITFPTSTRLHAWWNEIGSLFVMALRRGVQIQGVFHEGLPPVAAAPQQLTHAVLSLVYEAGEALEGPCTLRLWAEPEGGKFVKVILRDASPDGRRRDIEPIERRAGAARAFASGVGGSLEIDEGTVTLLLPVAPAVAESAAARPSTRLPRRRAEILLKDPRAAAFVTSLLASAGFEVAPRRDASVLAVWEGTEDPATVKRYLGENSSRRILLLGAPASPAPPRRVAVVSEPGNLEAVRRTLGTMVEELLEITDDTI